MKLVCSLLTAVSAVFISGLSFADSDIPACRAEGVPKAYQGVWQKLPMPGEFAEDAAREEFRLSEKHFHYFDLEDLRVNTSRAWICWRSDTLFLVLDFGPDAEEGRYESIWITSSGSYLTFWGEVYPEVEETDVKNKDKDLEQLFASISYWDESNELRAFKRIGRIQLLQEFKPFR
ncbi:MAG: hypothetical protein EA369_06955 [Bradymonadales bacterium]|nr:MAG: hypothetical protein EA369_06955 [Bradymonadales bacterium]